MRQPVELQISEFPGAVNIPLHRLEKEAKKLNPALLTILISRTGERAAQALKILKPLGFGQIKVLKGGLNNWAENINPTISEVLTMKTRSKKLFMIFPILLVLLSCSFMNNSGPGNEVETSPPEEVAQLPATAEISPEAPTPAPSPTAAMPEVPVLITKTIQEAEDSPKYTLEINYPYFEGSPEYESFNLNMDETVANIHSDFLDVTASNEEWRAQNMPKCQVT